MITELREIVVQLKRIADIQAASVVKIYDPAADEIRPIKQEDFDWRDKIIDEMRKNHKGLLSDIMMRVK